MRQSIHRQSKYIKCIFAIIFLTLCHIWGSSSQLIPCISYIQCIAGETKTSHIRTKQVMNIYPTLVIQECVKSISEYESVIPLIKSIRRTKAKPLYTNSILIQTNTTPNLPVELQSLFLPLEKRNPRQESDKTETPTISYMIIGIEDTKDNKVYRIKLGKNSLFYDLNKLPHGSRYIPDKIPISIYC